MRRPAGSTWGSAIFTDGHVEVEVTRGGEPIVVFRIEPGVAERDTSFSQPVDRFDVKIDARRAEIERPEGDEPRARSFASRSVRAFVPRAK